MAFEAAPVEPGDVIPVHAVADRPGLAGTRLPEDGGTSATGAEDGFDRHRRDVRTHTLHDPARWKYRAVTRYRLTGERPPRHDAI